MTSMKASHAGHTSRRVLLAGAALVAPAALLPGIAAAAEEVRSLSVTALQTPDPHSAWHAEWQACLDWCNTADVGGRDLVEFDQWHRLDELEELIHGTPARTLAGVLAQLQVLNHWHGEETSLNERDSAGLAHAIATVERLAAEAGHA